MFLQFLMLSKQAVNKTKLHPQGITPHIPHSLIEEVFLSIAITD